MRAVSLIVLAAAGTLGSSGVHALSPALEQCVVGAAMRYQVPADLIRAHLRVERGCGRVSKMNSNGTRDLGCMQVNDSHLPELAKLGITRDQVINADCLNINLGAYYMKLHQVEEGGDFWRGVGAYNTGKWSPRKEAAAQKYRLAIWRNLVDISQGR